MYKIYFIFFISICGLFAKNVELKVGATPIPSSQILEFIKPILKKEGIELIVEVFSDYVSPDIALNNGDIDANLYQHRPFLDFMNNNRNLKLVGLSSIYISPLGFYSNKFINASEIKDGAIIAIPNDPTNYSRALILLNDNGIIKLRDSNDLDSTEFDIIDNPKRIKFIKIESRFIPTVLNSLDGAVITSNSALQSGFSIKNSIFYENNKNTYAIILATREGKEKDLAILKLQEVLLSNEVKEFIVNRYNGIIMPIR